MKPYILWLAIFGILPNALIGIANFRKLAPFKKVFVKALLGSSLIYLPWDNLAIKNRVWFFPDNSILGIWILGIPLEEWGFLIFMIILFTSLTLLFYKKYGVK